MGWVGDRRFSAALAVAYVAGVAVLVASPWGWELNRLTVRLYVFFRRDVPVAPEWVRPEDYGVLLNVLLFVPVGVLLAAATGRAWWLVTLVCLVGSVVIEVSQARWLERDGDWTDVVANTLGGLVGAAAVSLRRRVPRAPGRRPGRPRRH